MKILVASDLSEGAARAVARGFRLARQLEADLAIIHVVDTALPSRLSQEAMAVARETLESQCATLAAETGIVPAIEVRGGNPRLELVARAKEAGAELVLVGMHRRRGLAPFIFDGSLPGAIFAALRRPMLVVRNAAEADYARVVVGIDFSVFSRPAIGWAHRLAPNGTLTLVHGFQIPFKPYAGGEDYGAEFAYAERLEMDQFLAGEMDWLTERARAGGVPLEVIETRVIEGQPAEVLRQTAAETAADLLVVGTHGRTGLMKAILGSVAADLVRDPPTDLLVVPAR